MKVTQNISGCGKCDFTFNSESIEEKEEKLLSVSFRYLIKNDKFTYKHRFGGHREGIDALRDLYNLIDNISCLTYTNLKKSGKFEMDAANKFRRKKGSLYDILKNNDIVPNCKSPIIVIRFGKGDSFRAVFKRKPDDKNILFLLACDWNYKLYNHGN